MAEGCYNCHSQMIRPLRAETAPAPATAPAAQEAAKPASQPVAEDTVARGAAGVVMIAWGLIALLQIRGYRIFRHNPDSGLQRAVRRAFAIASRKPPVVRAGTVGLLSAFLPCGWLWAVVVTSYRSRTFR